MSKANSRYIDDANTGKRSTFENKHNKTTCDEARSQCDRLYAVLSTVEEDCKTYRIYLGCLSMLKSTQTLCQADFHYWMMLSTTEKLITEKCSPGDTSPIEPPREIFNYPIAPKHSKTTKISSLPACLDSSHGSGQSKSQYLSCALFGHPNLVPYSGERQTCRLQGAWPLVNNRYISVQVTGDPYNQLHFHDLSASAITQISVILKPDGKCLGDLTVPLLIYVATATSRLSLLFTNSRKEMPQARINIKPVEGSDVHEKVELSFGYINTRIIISRTLVAQGEYSLSVSVLLPTQVAHARPRSKQQSLVRELCSLGCPSAESIDDSILLSHTTQIGFVPPSIDLCFNSGLKGAFFDSCYLMSRLINHRKVPNRTPGTKRSIEHYLTTSISHVQNNFVDFSKLVSENFSIDLSTRSEFRPFKPTWRIQELDAQMLRSQSMTVTMNVLLTMQSLLVVSALISVL